MRFSDRLYDNHPAKDWNNSYPLGNGSLGVMANGNINNEIFYLNDDSFWSGSKNISYRKNDVFPKIKELALNEQFDEAEELLWKDVYGEYAESYLPLCELHIERDAKNILDYSRELNLDEAIFKVDSNIYKEECFVSHEDKVIVININQDRFIKSTLYFTSFTKHNIEVKVDYNTATIIVKNKAPKHKDPVGHPQENPIIYDEIEGIDSYLKCIVRVDGRLDLVDNKLIIDQSSKVNILISNSTNLREEAYEKAVEDIIDNATKLSYEDLKKRHVLDYKTLYNRVSLNINDKDISKDCTTIKGLKKYHKEGVISCLMFNYARYLMISASREDSFCMNLQGIWNNNFNPPWSSAYTVNVNIEMNYSIAESTNLSECHMPLFRQLELLEESGRYTAKDQLHTKGWCLGHNSDIWGHTNLTGRVSTFNPTQYALYLSGGAWLATHIFTHYEYTLDINFLSRYYYILRGVAEFYLDYMTFDEKSNSYILCPGSSPENSYKYKGKKYSITKNATMDTAICRNIFNIIEKCSEILDKDKEFAMLCKERKEKLYPYKIGKEGELLEWYDNYEEIEKTHRHVSHLYGLYPDNQITIERTPDLAKACYTTIKRRGNKGIGWSLAWKVALLARLKKGDEALKTIYSKTLLYNPIFSGANYGGVYPNLFSAPPMQVDGNFGIAAAIKEMLLQDYDCIRLLPALPKKWKDGFFSGLKVKGNYKVDCEWKNNLVTKVKISSNHDGTIRVIVNEKNIEIPLNQEVNIK